MHRTALLTLVCACFLSILLCSSRATASSFQVNPVNITLSATTTNALLAVRNLSEEPVRVQVNIFEWNQTKDGEVELKPTHDLVFFPSILTIAPRQARNVRISAATNGNFVTPAVEKTYRIIIEELLPPAKMTIRNVTLQVLTRMSVPIFVQPATPRAVPELQRLTIQGRDASFVVLNAGTKHFKVRSIHVYVTAPNGQTLFNTSISGWYILARGTRAYKVTLPATACSRGASLTVEIDTDEGKATQHLNATCSK